LPVALKSENLPMGWKEAIYTYPSSIVYEIHGSKSLDVLYKFLWFLYSATAAKVLWCVVH
jgi:hypothetical protein